MGHGRGIDTEGVSKAGVNRQICRSNPHLCPTYIAQPGVMGHYIDTRINNK